MRLWFYIKAWFVRWSQEGRGLELFLEYSQVHLVNVCVFLQNINQF